MRKQTLLKPIALLVLSSVSPLSPASDSTTVYKKVLPDGSVVFSDQSQPGSETLEVKPVSTVPAFKAPQPQVQEQNPDETKIYTSFKILSPSDGGAEWSGSGSINIELNLEPALKKGHAIALYIDQELKTQGQSLNYNLSGIERGTHTLKAVVLNSRNQELTSQQANFTLHRPSVNR